MTPRKDPKSLLSHSGSELRLSELSEKRMVGCPKGA